MGVYNPGVDTKAEVGKIVETKIATFGAGCFWGIEEAFRQKEGVVGTSVGYMGGSLRHPSYEEVCTDSTGHVEVVQVEYDPKVVTYRELIDTFWKIHDPTQVNRQGWDVGSQYKSAIFFHDEGQKSEAIHSKANENDSGRYHSEIVTEVLIASEYWVAEEYHQKYLEKRGLGSCHSG